MPRPAQREIPLPVLLDRFVEYDRDERRKVRAAAVTQTGFAKRLDKTPRTVHQYFADANLPFPPVSPGELVLLLDNAPPHELLWISEAWCELTGHQREDLLYQPVKYLRETGIVDGPREMHQVLARELRAGAADASGVTQGWICEAIHHQRLPVSIELRFGHRSNAFYARATPLKSDVHDGQIFNVEPGFVLRHSATLDRLDVLDREQLLRLYEASLPRYTFGENAS
jgi:hypothetical protein